MTDTGPAHPVDATAADRYRTLEEVATWEHGVLLRATDLELGREVLLKTIRPGEPPAREAVERLLAEARLAGGLQHPGVAPVYDLGLDTAGRPFFSMRLLTGEALADLLHGDEARRGERARLLRVLEAASQTLAYAHARGVVHGNVTAEAVRVGAFGEVQLVDWSWADLESRGADPRTDVRALGRILQEILEGTAAGDGGEESGALAELGRSLLEPEPTLGAADVARELGTYLASAETRAHRARLEAVEEAAAAKTERLRAERARVEAEAQRRRRRHLVAFSLAVALVLLTASVGWAWLASGRRARETRTREMVEAALREAVAAREVGSWDAALEAASGAVGLAGSDDAPAGLRAEAQALHDEIAAAAAAARTTREREARERRLEADLARAWTRQDLDPPESTEAAYRQGFEAYGFDLGAMEPIEARRRIAQDPQAPLLVRALAEWRKWRRELGDAAVATVPALDDILSELGPGTPKDLDTLRAEVFAHPDDGAYHLLLARALRERGLEEKVEATWHLTAAAVVGSDRAGIQVHLGDAWRAVHRPRLAAAAYEAAAALEPGWTVPRERLGALGTR